MKRWLAGSRPKQGEEGAMDISRTETSHYSDYLFRDRGRSDWGALGTIFRVSHYSNII